METEAIVEFAGLTREAVTLIEGFRTSPSQTKSDIIVRALSNKPPAEDDGEYFDLGQGARLKVGEKPVLFLTRARRLAGKPDAQADVRSKDDFFLYGEKIEPSNGSVLQPAMALVQERLNHKNAKGELVSLSAWRQWHVQRDGRLVRCYDLKDPRLARRRGMSLVSNKTAEDLGL